MGCFYLATVQAILLYGSESWTLTQQQLRLLEAFHHRSARHIARNPIRMLSNGEWHTPRTEDVLAQVGLLPIHVYIQNCRDHIRAYAKSLPIFTKCEASTPTPITARHIYWWQMQNLPEPTSPTTTNTTNPIAVNPIHNNHMNHPHPRSTSNSYTHPDPDHLSQDH